jgi:glutaredoxin
MRGEDQQANSQDDMEWRADIEAREIPGSKGEEGQDAGKRSAPNISLNLQNRMGRRDIRTTAAIGLFLQLAVLVYSGLLFITQTSSSRKGITL